MLFLVAVQVIFSKTACQQERLAKGKAQPFAGDRIDSPGSIADQYNVCTADTFQLARDGKFTPLRRGGCGRVQTSVQFREAVQGLVQAQLGIMRHQPYAYLLVAYGCHIDLAALPPIDLHVIRPGSDSIVAPTGVAKILSVTSVEIGPSPYPRVSPIGSDDPLRVNSAISQADSFRRNPGHSRSPQELNPQALRTLGHDAMQRGSPHAKATCSWKLRVCSQS